MRVIASLLFIAAIVGANVATATFGLISLPFGVVTAGTFAAGAVLVLRDFVQDTAGRVTCITLIVIGAGISAGMSTTQLAIASGVAFLTSEMADFLVYTPLRERTWAGAVLISGLVGGAIDTALFLWIAGFPVASGLGPQLIVKTCASLLAISIVYACRVIFRQSVNR